MRARTVASVLLASAASVLATVAPPGAGAQPPAPGKIARVGYLTTQPSLTAPQPEAFRHGLRDAGWIEGGNLVLEYAQALAGYDELAALAQDLVRKKVDVIFAAGAPAALAAKQATAEIPIVFEMLGDPVRAGLVTNLARPGGNLTGQAGLAPELGGKRLELLREMLPRVASVAVLANPGNPATSSVVSETEAAAASLGLRVRVHPAREPAAIDRAFAAMAADRVDAVVVVQDPMLFAQQSRIFALTARHRLPAIYSISAMAEAGGLLAYAPNLAELFRRAAGQVDRILRGARPGDLPVEQPTRFELIVNVKAARALGLTVPPALLLRADRVVE
jgi:putative ABC transport system substrate-binding protein